MFSKGLEINVFAKRVARRDIITYLGSTGRGRQKRPTFFFKKKENEGTGSEEKDTKGKEERFAKAIHQ